MQTFSTYEAKTQLSKLIAAVQNGGEIIITKAGTPAAILRGYTTTATRTPNVLANKISIQDDFDDLPSGFNKYFSIDT